ncbi:MAG: helix-turn-helix domain-containing protein [Chloroflexota bacterium]|nr:helix-turn-helix domain-containing protein [Chloroflexota bacterium]
MSEHNTLEATLEEFRTRLDRLERTADSRSGQPNMDRLGAAIDERVEKEGINPKDQPVGQVEINALLRIPGNTWGYGDSFTLEDLLGASPDALAKGIGGLAHPVRITLFKALLTGPKESPELLAIAELNTTGQLYHHLQAMADVGLVERRGRSLWASQNPGAFVLLMAAGKILADWRGPE